MFGGRSTPSGGYTSVGEGSADGEQELADPAGKGGQPGHG